VGAGVNHRFRSLKYGPKRLANRKKRKTEDRQYNKSYPGELMHSDSKRLPLIKSEDQTLPREYLIVAIDDHSRELYAGILGTHSAGAHWRRDIETGTVSQQLTKGVARKKAKDS
jgi:hypothetical protein